MRWKLGFVPSSERRSLVTASPNPAATTHLPFFITAPGDTDVLFNITLVFVVACIILTGVIFLTIHSLPERMAHKSKKVLLDLIALLCLLALLTHEHLFWFIAIVLAFIDVPDFLTPVNRIARSVATLAGEAVGDKPEDRSAPAPSDAATAGRPGPQREAVHG
jgi:hypothetical protein